MKFEINGIEKGRTIKSVQMVNSNKRVLENEKPEKIKIIMVNYLDGTQDVVECTDENINSIKEIIDEQATKFANPPKQFMPLREAIGTSAILSIIIGAISVICFVSSNGVDITRLIMGALSGLTSVGCLANTFRLKAKANSIKKHKIYVDKIKDNLDSYNEILNYEKSLVNDKKKTPSNIDKIVNIDEKSIGELEQIANKIDRFPKISGNKQKIKSL